MGFEPMVEQDPDRIKWELIKQKEMGFEPTVEQDPDRIKWELIKRQNRFMTKRDGV